MARYRVIALAAVLLVACFSVGAWVWFVLSGLSVPTIVVLVVAAAFVVGLALAGTRGIRRTHTPYW